MSVRNEREIVLSSATCPGCHREWPVTKSKKRQESLFPSSTTGRHSPLKPYQNECSALWSQRRKEGDNGFEDKTGRRHQPSANLQTLLLPAPGRPPIPPHFLPSPHHSPQMWGRPAFTAFHSIESHLPSPATQRNRTCEIQIAQAIIPRRRERARLSLVRQGVL